MKRKARILMRRGKKARKVNKRKASTAVQLIIFEKVRKRMDKPLQTRETGSGIEQKCDYNHKTEGKGGTHTGGKNTIVYI